VKKKLISDNLRQNGLKEFIVFLFPRSFLPIVGLLLLTSEFCCQRNVECEFENKLWFHISRTLKTCTVNKTIEDSEFIVASPQDSTIQGFYVRLNKKFDWKHQKLSQMFSKLKGVAVWGCGLQLIIDDFLKGLHELLFLDLELNEIESIQSDAFRDNSKLEVISLSHNNLKYLSEDHFKLLVNLQVLNLDHNKIRFIDPFAFKDQKNLKTIQLARNEIKFLDPKTLETLTFLEKLSLSFNQLETIDGNLLRNNKLLSQIFLDNNRLKSIDFETFDDMKNLTSINLTVNKCIDDIYDDLFMLKLDVEENCTVRNVKIIAMEMHELNMKMRRELENYKAVVYSKRQELQKCVERTKGLIDSNKNLKEVLKVCKKHLRN
jgi:hypothetical protein